MRKLQTLFVALALVCISFAARGMAADSGDPAAVGSKAPDFTLQNQDGGTVNLHDFSGKIVVLEWTNPNCPFVQRHYHEKTMQTLAAQFKDDVSWLAINSSRGATNAADKHWSTEQDIPYPVLNDVDTTVGKAYHATNTPEMFIIGKDGTLLYKGAIDNDPTGDKTTGKVNYVQQALTEILAGKPVSVPETKPYGCHVNYRD